MNFPRFTNGMYEKIEEPLWPKCAIRDLKLPCSNLHILNEQKVAACDAETVDA